MDDVKQLRASIQRYEQAYYNELRTLVECYPQLSGNFRAWLKGAKSIVATLCPDGILVGHWPSQQDSFKFRQSPRPLEIVLEQTTALFRVTFPGTMVLTNLLILD
jgi:hypothetical protein